jgi:hypothetical protein
VLKHLSKGTPLPLLVKYVRELVPFFVQRSSLFKILRPDVQEEASLRQLENRRFGAMSAHQRQRNSISDMNSSVRVLGEDANTVFVAPIREHGIS